MDMQIIKLLESEDNENYDQWNVPFSTYILKTNNFQVISDINQSINAAFSSYINNENPYIQGGIENIN